MVEAARYLAGEVLERELSRVFRRAWLLACPSARIAQPGDFAVFDLAAESVILWRAHDGVVRAFVNACPHRGTRLLDGAGRRERLVCPYHCFSFGDDGRLLSAPYLNEPPELSLQALPAEERFGLVWVDFGAERSLDEHLAPIADLLRERSLQGFGLSADVSVDLACNWKISADVHGEALHVPSLHPEIASKVDFAGARIVAHPPHAVIEVAPRVEGLGTNVLVYVFPNAHLNLHADYALIFRHCPHATDPQRSRFDQYALAKTAPEQPEPPRRVAADDPAIGPITAADLHIAERVQRGLGSGRISPTLTHPERLLGWMLHSLDRHLAENDD